MTIVILWIPAFAGMTEGGQKKKRGKVSWGVPPDPHQRDFPLQSLRLPRFARNDRRGGHNDRVNYITALQALQIGNIGLLSWLVSMLGQGIIPFVLRHLDPPGTML